MHVHKARNLVTYLVLIERWPICIARLACHTFDSQKYIGPLALTSFGVFKESSAVPERH